MVHLLSHIPAWAFLLLLFGIYRGISALFERSVSLVAVSIMPIVFLVLSVSSLVTTIRAVPVGTVAWAAAICLGVFAGATVLSMKVLDRSEESGTIRIAGSAVTLVLFLLIFTARFYYGVHVAMVPSASRDAGFVSAILGLSGLSTGIMIGRISRLLLGRFTSAECALHR